MSTKCPHSVQNVPQSKNTHNMTHETQVLMRQIGRGIYRYCDMVSSSGGNDGLLARAENYREKLLALIRDELVKRDERARDLCNAAEAAGREVGR